LERAVVIDPSISGISGDMLLAALIDVGADPSILKRLSEAVARAIDGVESINIGVESVLKRGVRAKAVRIKIVEKHLEKSGADVIQDVEAVADEVGLGGEAKRIALNAIRLLVEAEASVHGVSTSEVHLHEVGSADTATDIVGVAMALESLGLVEASFYSLPVAVGGGHVKMHHGLYPAPAPVVLELLKRRSALFFGGPVEEELATPTGVAILASLVGSFTKFLPLIRVEGVGYGAGQKDFNTHPNVLRVLVGKGDEFVEGLEAEDIAVLETDVDDVSGELVGYAVEKLFELGAKDVSIQSLYMKKNRPGYTVKVVSDLTTYPTLVKTLISELGTLGVRVFITKRLRVPVRERRVVDVEIGGRRYGVEVKVSTDYRGNVVVAKPEYESVRSIAKELGVPLRRVLREVRRAVEKLFGA
jgi:uncharacterized protein (TIGR00299 family) protein